MSLAGGPADFCRFIAMRGICFSYEVCRWPHHADFIQTPLPVLTMVLLVLGVQFFLMGCWLRCWCGPITNRRRTDLCGEESGIGFEDS
jgi:hypothetical protein